MNVTLNQGQNFDVKFSKNEIFNAEFSGVPKGNYNGSYIVTPSSSQQILPTEGKTLSQDVVVEAVTAYEGAYEVTPRLYSQGLDTDGKLMSDDVTVHEIPVARTTNPTGGLTVLIG